MTDETNVESFGGLHTMRARNVGYLFIICLVLTGFVLSACSSDTDELPNGKTLLESRCVECHNLSRVKSASMTREEWSRMIDRMITLGAELTSEENVTLLEYLEVTYP